MPHTAKPIDKNTVNLKLVIEYDGKNYSGWQRQKNEPSVQQKIEDSLAVIFKGEKITITGAGRTDAGVHAYAQCANFRIDRSRLQQTSTERLMISLNALLPGDIVIKSVKKVNTGFRARYSAKKREYIYRITESSRAIDREKVYNIKSSFDVKIARKFCKIITGNHSFKALCKNKTDDHGFRSIIYTAAVTKKKDGVIEFRISANRFLHSMVRAITGAMIKTATGRMPLEEFTEKFKKGDEIKIQYVPSNALFLSKVTY